MKLANQKNSKKTPLIIGALVVALLFIGAFTYFFIINKEDSPAPALPSLNSSSDNDVDKIPEGDGAVTEDQVPDSTTHSDTGEERTSKELLPTTNDSNADPITPLITRAEKTNTSIEVVAIFTATTGGKCELTLSKDGAENIIRTANVTVGPSYYICGFTAENVPGDNWTASVRNILNNKRSEPSTLKVE